MRSTNGDISNDLDGP